MLRQAEHEFGRAVCTSPFIYKYILGEPLREGQLTVKRIIVRYAVSARLHYVPA